MRSTVFALFLSFSATVAPAQSVNLGNPPVLNFLPRDYRAGTQTWDVDRDAHGVMWFANNSGLLEFDGTHWRLYPLDNGTIVRSVKAGNDGRVYVGGQGDFGYFSPDKNGRLHYRSLKPLIPEPAGHFTDVWDVLVRKEGVFFRTDSQVFHLQQERVATLFPADKSLSFMGEWAGKLLVQDSGLRLYVFENDRLRPLEQPAVFNQGRISAVLSIHQDTILVTTIKDGIFYYSGGAFQPWHTQNDAFLKESRIFCAGLLPDGKIALGTSRYGIVVLDRQRRIFHQLNKKSGLQNNSVLSLLATPGGSLWLGLDNGIDYVNLSSPITAFYPDGELQGTGYAARIFGDKIYFGTNSGLYATDWKAYYAPGEKEKFSLVKNSEGQVWSLNLQNDALLMGHHEGAFEIHGLEARKLTGLQGIWKFVDMGRGRALAGHYNGLAGFHRTDGGWVFDSPLEGFTESSRLLAKDGAGHIWMAHPYRGIYRITVDSMLRNTNAGFYNARQGLPSDLGNHLFQLGDRIVYTGEKGIFRFDASQQRFLPDENFNAVFGSNARIKYLQEDHAGNIWYVTDRETGILQVENSTLDKKVRKIPVPELQEKMTGVFQFILPVDDHNTFIATGQGFIHFDPAAYMPNDSTVHIVLQEVRLKGEPDSILFGGHAWPEASLPEINLSSDQNALDFVFSATDYPGSEFVRYAHFLEGSGRGWSEWYAESHIAFNTLSPGKYIFHVKARNQHGIESAVVSLPFEIRPPWYSSQAAYFAYGIFLLAVGAGVIYRQQKKFEREKQNLRTLHQRREEQHRLQARQSEEEINRLQNEKLEAEINHQTQELATATLHLVQKNDILNLVKDALERLRRKAATGPDLQAEIGNIIKVLENDERLDTDWEHFSRNFDRVHSEFLKRLGEQYPHLSPNDYKLCAYLRMNLSSKEIASLLNISLRGVEASRYRLRKRLGLDTEQNLTEFLMRF